MCLSTRCRQVARDGVRTENRGHGSDGACAHWSEDTRALTARCKQISYDRGTSALRSRVGSFDDANTYVYHQSNILRRGSAVQGRCRVVRPDQDVRVGHARGRRTLGPVGDGVRPHTRSRSHSERAGGESIGVQTHRCTCSTGSLGELEGAVYLVRYRAESSDGDFREAILAARRGVQGS